MTRRLPSLNALRAFEAAARHLSFTRAADELHVTAAAVSQQIRTLETQLNTKLFIRDRNSLRLTPAGESYLPGVRESFDRLQLATQELVDGRGGTLRVSVPPTFGAKWLVPRLYRFYRQHPDIHVRISAAQVADFTADEVDVAIDCGRGRFPGLHVERFITDEVSPVCSPALVDGPRPLRSLEDLAHHTLLHDQSAVYDPSCPDWRRWLVAAGAKGIDGERGPTFSPAIMVLQAAIDGHGVALGKSVLVEYDIAAGRLVRPFHLRVPVEFAYHFVCPVSREQDPVVTAFKRWLHREADGRAPIVAQVAARALAD
jgi:LysR family glycine cleavage system transcriptional activator